MGRAAGVANLDEFEQCSVSSAEVASISAGTLAGNKLAIRGTPTLLVNGWIVSPIPYDSLEREVRRALGASSAK